MKALPELTESALTQSATLTEQIRLKIMREGPMHFNAFMSDALYTPKLGYYMSRQSKIGTDGDFTTAPELSPAFGRCIAKQCDDILSELSSPIIIEFGGGSGALAKSILDSLTVPIEQYCIVEVSSTLKALQQETLKAYGEKINWLSELPNKAYEGIVLANEVLDAMPVHIFHHVDNHTYSLGVDCDTNGFIWRKLPLSTELIEPLAQLPTLDSVYTSEINLNITPWIKALSEHLSAGACLLIDYGFTRSSYYHPDRNQGTLMCHTGHVAHTNPLIRVGVQDITAHVDFTHVAEAAHASGFMVSGFCTQAAFLLNCGLLNDPPPPSIAHQLIHPNVMGELFKVMALTKGIDIPLIGFQRFDQRGRL